ncbi:MAG TPA: hypothetical protein PLF40_17455 [Kofleriaceae bacterium]|nr:hypothetical protein [Kofleriaceae bacterium]
MRRRTVIGVLVGLAACQASDFDFVTNSFRTDGFSGDPFPIYVDTSSGALLVGYQEIGSNDPPQAALLDIMAPISVFETNAADGVSVRDVGLTIFGMSQATGQLSVPRAQFRGSITNLQACPDEGCVVGPATAPRPITAILGSDNLTGDALRLRFDLSQIFVLPNIGPSDNGERTKLCDAVFSSPFRGGGTLLLGNTEVPFSGRRIALSACAAADPRSLIPQSQRGTNLLLVASTAIGPTLLSETAYRNYQLAHPTEAALEALPAAEFWLPSGLVRGRIGKLTNLTLAAESSEGRGACREAYAHHLLFTRTCSDTDDCPCIDAGNCGAPALLELAPTTGVRVLVVADDNTTLQGLRTELRPDQAEVDGVLGTEALRTIELDIDYPHGRVLARCVDANDATCKTRPTLSTTGARADIACCILPECCNPDPNNVPAQCLAP